MTARELSQLYYLSREIEQQKERLLHLTEKRKNWHEHDCVQTSNGIGCTMRTEWVFSLSDDHMENPFHEEIDALRQEIQRNLKKCLQERIRLEKYINGVEDSEMRQILSLRYINGLSWAQVAAHISAYATEDSVRMMHNRFLKKSCSQCSETP